MIWNDIVDIAPAVGDIIQSAAEVESPSWSDYVARKAALSNFVGYGAVDARLRNSEAFDIAIAHLLAVMELGVSYDA